VPTVTAIKPQKRNDRVNIYLDDKFGFGLDLENYLKLGIKVEQVLSEIEIEKIIQKANYQKTLNKLLRFATLRPRSEKEVNFWIKRKIGKELSEELLEKQSIKLRERLTQLDLLDDTKFAEWWINQRLSFRPMGRIRLRQELMMKGIDREIVSEKIAEMVDTDKEIDHAKDLLLKKIKQLQRYEYNKAYQKAYSFLARRGFDSAAIKSAIDDVGLKGYHSD